MLWPHIPAWPLSKYYTPVLSGQSKSIVQFIYFRVVWIIGYFYLLLPVIVFLITFWSTDVEVQWQHMQNHHESIWIWQQKHLENQKGKHFKFWEWLNHLVMDYIEGFLILWTKWWIWANSRLDLASHVHLRKNESLISSNLMS